ncbi:MAG TPA: hypothetical protein VKJ65_02875, partial [Phycisphaerae bacterium]|nr:hypothetical protein [Phycisphaerae bacterium]
AELREKFDPCGYLRNGDETLNRTDRSVFRIDHGKRLLGLLPVSSLLMTDHRDGGVDNHGRLFFRPECRWWLKSNDCRNY